MRTVWPRPDSRWRSRSRGFSSSENCQKLHFSRSISSAILAWTSKMMVTHDSMGPILQLFWARFSNFLLRKFVECRYYTNFKWPYFRTAGGYGHMVGHTGSSIHIAHTDVTLTWSKVKVTDLLSFRKVHFLRLLPPLFWRGAHNWWVTTVVWDLVRISTYRFGRWIGSAVM